MDEPPAENQPDVASPEPEDPGASPHPLFEGAAEAAGAKTQTTVGTDSELSDSPTSSSADPLDLGFILDIPLKVSVEVGRTKLLVQELLQLGQGSVIELDKQMGEPFEVLVNDKLVARGEIVVVNDRFGVRLTDIISPNDRVQSLR